MKKKSLARQFGILFVLFTLATILISGIMTYVSQTNAWHAKCVQDLQHLTNHLSGLIENEGREFSDLKTWFADHTEQAQIPMDFRADLPSSRDAFYSYLKEHYTGHVFGNDLFFDDLDEEGQRLYAIYRFEHWFTVFFDAVDEFELSYVYFIYPEEDKDHTMNYMFDPTMTPVTADDGSEILFLGDQVFEDPKLHKYMWEAWDTGKAPKGFDSLDNEFGHVYTYCQPVFSDGDKIGLICAEISVAAVNHEILGSVLRQSLVSIVVLITATILLYYFLRSRILNRIMKLGKDIDRYSVEKDPALAESIRSHKGQNDELGTLADTFSGMITELDEYMKNLQYITAEKERIGAELNVATQIQADMLPRIFPAFPEFVQFDIFASMSPAKEVGGDFYDFFLVDDTHLALVIADVSGKGVPAALFMVIAKTLIKNRVQMGEQPAEALINVNNQLCEGNDIGLFVTVWLAVIDLETGHALEANAGHEYPAIRRKDGSYEFIRSKHSPAVATFEGLRFRQSEFDLQPGDGLFIYTDGVTEATNANNELFGEERLLNALNSHRNDAPVNLLPEIRKSIDAFVKDAPQFDDITMLGFQYFGNNKEEK